MIRKLTVKENMKRTGFYCGLLVLLSLAAGAAYGQNIPLMEVPADYGYIVKPGQVAPDFTMMLTGGKRVKMSDLRGKVVMLQFTASWCGVCRKEMPYIEREIWKKYKNNPGFALYGIDMDEPLDKVVKFGKEVGITYPLALDPDAAIFYLFAQKGAGVTRNVIIDKNGKIVFLTRLFKEEEFNRMKQVIALLLDD
ncbi:MAG TPA: TlpA disulfide reductase family protein [Prolixibacteraceae bacterium]|nr:TlpA disulfide reductase family protein [Prolixibacteraceae bacterium]HOR99848.1 TlpA disulfide reductase family protein [Prolixibacteraceae bacterium]HOS89738.1 TlpA disulfide reductase family protein [Prolixibacteraceae bacterium]HPL44740.1 TlpA disulfide reductase family protein [Prolixibacteraceae bacterium]HPV19537.1 TlpA disulfide reductase family protein [Prolixibacteraceae bacterium]